jgi:hypothetical protein
MSDVSTTSGSSWDQVNLGDLEARLNSLGGESATEPAAESETPTLLEQFMSHPTLNFLGSRSTDINQESQQTETVVQYHRISFAANQTRQILHLSFQPDLAKAPSVEVNLIDADGRTRITQSTPFGVRVEISLLSGCSTASSVCVEAICTTASAY